MQASGKVKVPSAEVLAKEFSRVIREWLTPKEMATVLRKNEANSKTKFKECCATQDVCDANMAMDEAMRKVAPEFYKRNLGGRRHMTVKFMFVWNEAWDMAKAAKFYPPSKVKA